MVFALDSMLVAARCEWPVLLDDSKAAQAGIPAHNAVQAAPALPVTKVGNKVVVAGNRVVAAGSKAVAVEP